MASVDTSRLVVNSSGRTSFSGLGSGIDFEAAVESMVAAKRIPIDRLKDTVSKNGDKIKAYADLTSSLTTFRESLNKLRGVISADRSTNIFYNKETFANSSRGNSLLYNPNRTTASSAAGLVGVTVTNQAEAGSYEIEVLRTARAQKDSSQVFTSTTQVDRSASVTSDSTDLSTLIGGWVGGTFTINGQSIIVDPSDTLQDVQNAINSANAGVTATIVNPGAGDYRLVITNNTVGNTTTYGDDTTNDTLTLLGVLDGSDAIANQVQAGLRSSTSPLNQLVPGFTGGTFSIFGTNITLDATNSLLDVRDRINAANSGVTASILSASSTESYLVITNSDTGETITYSDSSDVLAALGVLNVDDSVKNQLQASQTAQFTANGLRDQSRKRSDIIYNPGATLATLASGLITTGAQSFRISSGATNFTVNYTDGMTINQLVSAINAAAGVAGSDVVASMETVEGGNGGQRLIIKDTSGDNVTLDSDTGGFVSAFAFTDPRILERTSNTVNDLITGMTINLFAAEGGTTIKIDVEQDLTDIKTQIASFVTAYNDLVIFMNQQAEVDPITGQPTEDTGALFGSSVLTDLKARIGTIISSAVSGTTDGFSVLGSIGIKFVKNNEVSDPLEYNTLTIDEEKLDEKLLNNADDVRRLFTFDGTTNDSRFAITGFSGDMSYNAGGIGINFTHDGTAFTAADIGGDSSAVEINGNTLTIKSGPAAGMVLYYSGGAASGSFTTQYTVGFAADMFAELDDILTADTGLVDNEVDTLKKINETTEERISRLEERIETFRQMQLEKFYRMEQAVSRSNSILGSLKQTVDAQNKSS